MTPWPGVIPMPSYLHLSYSLEETPGSGVLRATEPRVETKTTGESYLLLLDLDLADPQQILQFANRYGAILINECWPSDESSLHDQEHLDDWYDAVNRRLGVTGAEAANVHIGRGDETLDSFTLGALCVRDLVHAWRAIRDQLDPHDLNWEAGRVSTTGDASELLRLGLGAGLAFFPPEVEIWDGDMRFDDPIVSPPARGPRKLRPPFPYYAVACLELYNHIAENATYQRCANERCGRLFVRQQGRAHHQQHRTKGVLYCSASCATAQAKRAQRRREKLRKNAL